VLFFFCRSRAGFVSKLPFNDSVFSICSVLPFRFVPWRESWSFFHSPKGHLLPPPFSRNAVPLVYAFFFVFLLCQQRFFFTGFAPGILPAFSLDGAPEMYDSGPRFPVRIREWPLRHLHFPPALFVFSYVTFFLSFSPPSSLLFAIVARLERFLGSRFYFSPCAASASDW